MKKNNLFLIFILIFTLIPITSHSSGYRTMRTTKDTSFIGFNGKLKIPSYYASINDSSPEIYDGVYPELFLSFCNKDCFLDIGLVYKNNNWKIFCYSPNSLKGTSYVDFDLKFQVNPDDVLKINTYLENGTLIFKISKENKEQIEKINLKDGSYKKMKNGCNISREMNIATNRTDGYISSQAYFINAEWQESTLTTYNYQYIKWTNLFGAFIINKDTNNDVEEWIPDKVFFEHIHINGYAVDKASINFK